MRIYSGLRAECAMLRELPTSVVKLLISQLQVMRDGVPSFTCPSLTVHALL